VGVSILKQSKEVVSVVKDQEAMGLKSKCMEMRDSQQRGSPGMDTNRKKSGQRMKMDWFGKQM